MERERVGVSIWKAVCDFEGTDIKNQEAVPGFFVFARPDVIA